VLIKEFKQANIRLNFQPNGTTILEGLKLGVSNPSLVTYDPWANELSKDDVIVAVIGEYPYAEGYGDNPSIGISSFDKNVLKKCYKSGNKLIVIMLSGRPLLIDDHINKWDGFISAWLPGMAGEGISDVILGDYSPTGRLSFSWPKNIKQVPVNIGDPEYAPMFPYGYGLSY